VEPYLQTMIVTMYYLVNAPIELGGR
jgi:hypothetical protein